MDHCNFIAVQQETIFFIHFHLIHKHIKKHSQKKEKGIYRDFVFLHFHSV